LFTTLHHDGESARGYPGTALVTLRLLEWWFDHNRPRQFYPDFVVAVREKDGTETMWLAETKGEMRTNVPLKNGAAQLWCKKMSTTKYGAWRYLFAQQLKLEKALGKGITTFEELASNLYE
jgi:hypothetical protein